VTPGSELQATVESIVLARQAVVRPHRQTAPRLCKSPPNPPAWRRRIASFCALVDPAPLTAIVKARFLRNAKGSANADKGEQGSGPSAVETREERQPAEQMDRYREPDRDIGRGHVNAGEILRRTARIEQLADAVLDEQARHQQSCEGQ
jgi:hypothetical protein